MAILFDVTEDGVNWYRNDSERPYPELYVDGGEYWPVPNEIVSKAEAAIDTIPITPGLGFDIDPKPLDEKALMEAFKDVRFISSDWIPGVIY